MAKDMSDTLKDTFGSVVREAAKNVGNLPSPGKGKKGSSPLSGARGLAAGAGVAALVPLARKGVSAARGGGLHKPKGPVAMVSQAASNATDKVTDNLKSVATDKIDEAGGAGGIAKKAAGGLLPGFGGGDDDGGGGGKGGVAGVGKGRRMPVQQAVDVAVPIETAYNQFTQWEDWSTFMHRVTNVSQDDPCTVKFSTKIWTRKREFTAEIDTQRPDERIKWHVSQGITHKGVVTFHELAPRLTRIELNFDVEPGGMIEKMARGMRHVKRAARADLHRFKAFIEMAEHETGAWRGVIEDGELVEDHDPSYDEEREYSDIEDFVEEEESEDEDADEDEEKDEKDEGDEDEERSESNGQPQQERRQRFKRQAEASRRGRSKAESADESEESEEKPAPRRRTRAAATSNPSSSRTAGRSKAKSTGTKSKSRRS